MLFNLSWINQLYGHRKFIGEVTIELPTYESSQFFNGHFYLLLCNFTHSHRVKLHLDDTKLVEHLSSVEARIFCEQLHIKS